MVYMVRKEYQIKGEGVDTLKSYLDMVAESATTATYTLKIYEDLDSLKDIKAIHRMMAVSNFKLFPMKEPVQWNYRKALRLSFA